MEATCGSGRDKIEMKEVLYMVFGILLVIQMVSRVSSMDNTITPNSYTKQKCFLKQTRFKPVSSYVKKVKKIKVGPVSIASSDHSQSLEGDDLGHDDKLENTHEDLVGATTDLFCFFATDKPLYGSLLRQYNLFTQHNIPPPEYS